MESKLEQIVNYYGKELQTIVAIEEMAELTKVLSKIYRHKGASAKDIQALEGEMADVLLMLKQMQIIYGITDEALNGEIEFKIYRTLVEAIPIEWIEEWGWKNGMSESMSLRVMIDDWKKENETDRRR